MRGKIKTALLVALLLVGVAVAPFLSLRTRSSYAQNNTPVYPPQVGAQVFTQGVVNGCSGSGTLANGVLAQTLACMKNGGFSHCQAWSNGASALTYASIGIECAPTTTATATTAATATATTAAYGGTTIATSVATTAATSTAIGGVAITASTLNASPVVVWEGIN